DLADQTKSVDESRRRFTKSGLAISGVILTLASRPVLGDFVCKSPSGFLSGNVSAHGTPLLCSGLTPGYWGNWGGSGPQPNMWPSPYLPGEWKKCDRQTGASCTHVSEWSGGTLFSSVFNCNGNGTIYSSYTMMQVIWLGGGGDTDQLGAHIVSALLNAKSGFTPVLTEAQVVNMFNEWNQNGYFEPTAGVKWYAKEIVAYLQTTMS
ncbi:MAG: hypothetical protein Q8O38_14960, partial [Sulfurimicrobium sp.]|nr:hypothetical protein [Sulfurimicrobium sp.]